MKHKVHTKIDELIASFEKDIIILNIFLYNKLLKKFIYKHTKIIYSSNMYSIVYYFLAANKAFIFLRFFFDFYFILFQFPENLSALYVKYHDH